ncbi:MAG: TetR/AcrR family transcriptional regulator [Gammaproteobacteria bacterium]|nr:TetR/AcrR family transcriptional regulator [Gammaproteobacteria bacterium]NNL11637.1 hypothetical protein [Pseudomonadales bacterium]
MLHPAPEGAPAMQPVQVADPATFIPLLEFDDFASFSKAFPYANDGVYELLYDLCKESIKTKRRPVAIANLKKIFQATFKICAQRSFEAMSLRELSTGTGISMGGLYACLQSKQDLVLMAQVVVDHINHSLDAAVLSEQDPWRRLQQAIRTHIYISTPLQPWFFLLYFETHTLEPEQQLRSKNIEMRSMRAMQLLIEEGVAQGQLRTDDAQGVATIIIATLQDWYLKPWKYRELRVDADAYANQLLASTAKLLEVQK